MIHSADTTIRALDVRAARPTARPQASDFSRSLKDLPGSPARTASVRPHAAEQPASAAAGFVRSSASSAQGQVPRFESVPEAAKSPQGPYRQAPAEFGGEWWLVNPFSGPQPWVRAAEITVGAGQADIVPPPDDFLKLFGPRPDRTQSSSRGEHVIKTFVWDRELANFEGVGIPDGFTEEQVRTAADAMKEWGTGEPVFYKSRGVWITRFPDSQLPQFQISPETAIKAPQVGAGVYHVQAILRGVEIENRHPLVPSGVFPLDRYKLKA